MIGDPPLYGAVHTTVTFWELIDVTTLVGVDGIVAAIIITSED
jgi:hypothetical protein